jgi:hypothetical protein
MKEIVIETWRTFCRFFNRNIKMILGSIMALILSMIMIAVLISSGILADSGTTIINLMFLVAILGILATVGIKLSGTILKITLFLGYHITVFGLIWFVMNWLWVPIFENQWITGFDWLRATILGASYLGFSIGLVLSIASCFDSTKITATQIGQWTAMGRMPKALKNQKNSFGGYFCGLPSSMVEMKTFSTIVETYSEEKNLPIQINKDGKDQTIEVDLTFMYRSEDSLTLSTQKDEKVDNKILTMREKLFNIDKKYITEWFNNFSGNVAIVELQTQISKIEEDVFAKFKEEALKLYGMEIVDFKIINIQVPTVQINIQNDAAAAMVQQTEGDKRERINAENKVRQIAESKKLLEKETGEEISLSDFMAYTETLEGRRHVTEIAEGSTGNGKKGSKKVIPVIIPTNP